MIKLEMELSDIDYEVLVKEILPKVADRLKQNGSPLAPLLSGGMAANVLLRASDSVRDRMAAEILNAAARTSPPASRTSASTFTAGQRL